MEYSPESWQIAVALRTARSASGLSQEELAEKLDVPRLTIQRIETLETTPKADIVTRAVRFFRGIGIELDYAEAEQVAVTVNSDGLEAARRVLESESAKKAARKNKLVK